MHARQVFVGNEQFSFTLVTSFSLLKLGYQKILFKRLFRSASIFHESHMWMQLV